MRRIRKVAVQGSPGVGEDVERGREVGRVVIREVWELSLGGKKQKEEQTPLHALQLSTDLALRGERGRKGIKRG